MSAATARVACAIALLVVASAPSPAAQITVPPGASIALSSGSLDLACGELSVQGSVSLGSSPAMRAGNLAIASGATLDAGAAALMIGGNWANAGTFVRGTSAVVFADGCTTAPALLTGTTVFANLGLTSAQGRTFVLPTGGATTVTGSLTLSGSAGIPITVASADPNQPTRIVLFAGAAYTSTFAALGPGVAVGPDGISPAFASLEFGGQSMGTTSPAQLLTLTNTSVATVSISSVAASTHFTVAHDCAALAPGGSCTASVRFTPGTTGVALNGTSPMAGALTITSNATGSPSAVSLSGTAEKSLVTHYYRSILRRAPDAGGKAFWQAEAARVATLGANVNETWYSLSQAFYFSPEYAAFNGNDTAFVTDLYTTFFNRAPDSGGLNYWVGNLSSGMPREVLLAQFMFSPEFQAFSQAIFGNTAVRAELDMVIDFYRGVLGRLPDDGGFNYWVARFRAAQCTGQAAIVSEVEAISSAFTLSPEYTGRNRTTAQYVGDLYNAFLRRGGDLAGVQFWINEAASGARTREQLRAEFKNSAEFQARVGSLIQQGCRT